MGIIITGLEMPTERESFNLTIKYNGTVLDTETGMQVAEAHELPPHGDLIDANAMFKDICDSINEMTAIGVAVDGQWLWDKLNDALKNAPTIIPSSEEVE